MSCSLVHFLDTSLQYGIKYSCVPFAQTAAHLSTSTLTVLDKMFGLVTDNMVMMTSSWKWVIIVFHCLNSFRDWFLRFFFSHDYIGVLWLAKSCIHPGLCSKLTWFSSSDTNFSNSHQNMLTISLGCKHHITNCPYATKKSGVYNLFNLLNINLLLFAQLLIYCNNSSSQTQDSAGEFIQS